MKNIDKYKEKIFQLIDRGNSLPCVIAIAAGISNGDCFGYKCSECQKKSFERMYSEQPDLTDEEKDIINSMCNVFNRLGCKVASIRKSEDGVGNGLICVSCKDEIRVRNYYFTNFRNDLFKGMELNKEYSPKDRGVEMV